MPPAHNILRGPVRGLYSFAVTTTAADLAAMSIDPQDHPVVFTPAQKREVQVRSMLVLSSTSCSSMASAGTQIAPALKQR